MLRHLSAKISERLQAFMLGLMPWQISRLRS